MIKNIGKTVKGFGEISLLYTDFAVILGMVYDFLPFMILPIHTSLTKMDKSLVEASNDLGANPVTITKIAKIKDTALPKCQSPTLINCCSIKLPISEYWPPPNNLGITKVNSSLWIGFALVFLYLPLVVMAIFSFNDSKSLSSWSGFSLRWYQELFVNQ